MVKDLVILLEDRGVLVKYVIYLVVGWMFGYMNVLLVEVEVDYDVMKDMDDINDEFVCIDVIIVIGVNDVINLVVCNEMFSLIYGMLIFNVDKLRLVIVFKWLMNFGFVGIDNLLFYVDGIIMLFGDVKKLVIEVFEEFKVL